VGTVTKHMLIRDIAGDTGYPISVVQNIVDSLVLNTTLHLSHNRKVQISGFGTFEMKRRNARVGRNPHTGDAVPIPARIIPSFEAGEKLKRDTISEKGV